MSPMTVVSGGLDAVNGVQLELGLPAVAQVPDLLDQCALAMVVTTEEFDRPDGPVPANVRYVGPIVERPGPDADWSPPWPLDAAPVIHACTSTVAPVEMAGDVLQRVLDAVAEEPAIMFVTAQDEVRDRLRLPSNAHVSGYVRHRVVLPLVDLFVTHAGFSSVAAALQCGVPMVCMPLMYEQPANAAHAEALGLARTVTSDASLEDIRAVVTSALADGGIATESSDSPRHSLRTSHRPRSESSKLSCSDDSRRRRLLLSRRARCSRTAVRSNWPKGRGRPRSSSAPTQRSASWRHEPEGREASVQHRAKADSEIRRLLRPLGDQPLEGVDRVSGAEITAPVEHLHPVHVSLPPVAIDGARSPVKNAAGEMAGVAQGVGDAKTDDEVLVVTGIADERPPRA